MTPTRCASCGLPGHRYGRNESPERYDPVACINSLRGEVERLRTALTNLNTILGAGNNLNESGCRTLRDTITSALAGARAHTDERDR